MQERRSGEIPCRLSRRGLLLKRARLSRCHGRYGPIRVKEGKPFLALRRSGLAMVTVAGKNTERFHFFLEPGKYLLDPGHVA
jgi:hypothetical protein